MVMAGSGSDEYLLPGGSSHMDGLSSMQHCQSVESLAEWRSCDQVENGVPSTSPPYWDSDDGEDSGPKPSDLFVKFTWKIENFSQTSKRELKSNVFEIGGYKWYILVYPQGCDVCNHLSLFLCVANHDKLLPGWSHFAQFTITVLNKDPKKNKYSDTLHRFWKKEHDWGWKKFMELTKVMDGFVVDDGSLTIKAQVQVIREKAHRPFRCLDCQYRREIIRVYLSNVEQTYAHFVQERRKKLQDLLNDKAKWSSFHAFWLGIDQATRRCMSRDKTEVILKVIVKHFFIEKEVSSTLIMDSLYTGLKALESQSKLEKVRTNLLEKEELQAPFIFIENDMFVLADDVFLLLERAASELPHPPLPAKEEKGVPNRTKDGCSGEEFNRESILRDERRLTELGRRTLEIFVLAHIFSSKIEIAYQEAVALKRQEELIREEAAEQAENVMRERRTKKKQAKQRRNNRKGKDRGKSEKSVEIFNEKNQPLNSPAERVSDDFSSDQTLQVNGKNDPKGDVSDVSDSAEALQPDIEGRDTGTLSWDTDTSEVHPRAVVIASEVQNGHMDKKSSTVMDDSSSTCSTDSVPSVVVNTQSKGNSSPNNKKKRTSNRGKKQRNKDIRTCSIPKTNQIPFASGTCRAAGPEPEVSIHALKDQIQKFEQLVEKEEVDVTHGNELIDSDPVDIDQEVCSKSDAVEPSSSSSEPSIEPLTVAAKNEQVSTSELTSNNPTTKSEQPVLVAVKSPQKPTISNPVALKHHSEATTSSASSMSRPSSTPLVSSQKLTVPVVSSSQTLPTLLQTLSSINCSDTKPSPFAQSFEPQSYRNAIMGIKTATSQSELGQPSSSSIFRPPSSLSMSSINGQTSRNIGFFGSHCRANDNTLSSRQSQGVMPDEFPHLDIINDLLDEDQMVGRAAISGYDNYHDDYPMNQQYTFPQDSCQFELPEYYYNEISQMVSFMPFHGLSDFSIYGNGMDAILQNYWPTDDADLSMMNFGCPMDVNGYGYQLPDYSPCGVNGYNMMYQPANGP